MWGYSGMYPVAKAYGMDFDNLKELLEVKSDEPLEKALTDKQRKAVLGNTTTPMVEVFEHVPLVGVSKHYTSDGRCTKYGYDTHGRLISVSDAEGKLKEFDYIQFTK